MEAAPASGTLVLPPSTAAAAPGSRASIATANPSRGRTRRQILQPWHSLRNRRAPAASDPGLSSLPSSLSPPGAAAETAEEIALEPQTPETAANQHCVVDPEWTHVTPRAVAAEMGSHKVAHNSSREVITERRHRQHQQQHKSGIDQGQNQLTSKSPRNVDKGTTNQRRSSRETKRSRSSPAVSGEQRGHSRRIARITDDQYGHSMVDPKPQSSKSHHHHRPTAPPATSSRTDHRIDRPSVTILSDLPERVDGSRTPQSSSGLGRTNSMRSESSVGSKASKGSWGNFLSSLTAVFRPDKHRKDENSAGERSGGKRGDAASHRRSRSAGSLNCNQMAENFRTCSSLVAMSQRLAGPRDITGPALGGITIRRDRPSQRDLPPSRQADPTARESPPRDTNNNHRHKRSSKGSEEDSEVVRERINRKRSFRVEKKRRHNKASDHHSRSLTQLDECGLDRATISLRSASDGQQQSSSADHPGRRSVGLSDELYADTYTLVANYYKLIGSDFDPTAVDPAMWAKATKALQEHVKDVTAKSSCCIGKPGAKYKDSDVANGNHPVSPSQALTQPAEQIEMTHNHPGNRLHQQYGGPNLYQTTQQQQSQNVGNQYMGGVNPGSGSDRYSPSNHLSNNNHYRTGSTSSQGPSQGVYPPPSSSQSPPPPPYPIYDNHSQPPQQGQSHSRQPSATHSSVHGSKTSVLSRNDRAGSGSMLSRNDRAGSGRGQRTPSIASSTQLGPGHLQLDTQAHTPRAVCSNSNLLAAPDLAVMNAINKKNHQNKDTPSPHQHLPGESAVRGDRHNQNRSPAYPPTSPSKKRSEHSPGSYAQKKQQLQQQQDYLLKNGQKALNPADNPHNVTDKINGITYTRGRLLGKGGFAKCYELTDIKSNRTYAGKIISKNRLTKPHQKEKILREIELHKGLRQRHIVSFHSYFEDDENVYIVLELCSRKSLVHVLKNRKTLTEPEVRYFVRHLVEGCRYVHSKRIIHRDLKLGNMLLNDHMNIKIGDFGLATRVEYEGEKKMTVCGTPNYIAPEVLQKKGHSYEADIWAIGCIMYAMLVGRPPFETSTLKETYLRITANKYFVPPHVSRPAKNLIQKLLNPDPRQRPTLEKILEDDFFSSGYSPKSLPQSCCEMAPKWPSVANDTYQHNSIVKIVGAPPSRPQSYAAPVTPAESINKIQSTLAGMKGSRKSASQIITRTDRSVVNSPRTANDPYVRQASSTPSGVHRSSSQDIRALPFGSAIRLYQQLTSCLDHMPQSDSNPEPVEHMKPLWVTKWVDYSNKYGFGFQLSDKSVGILFNDTTRMLLACDGKTVQYNDLSNHVYTFTTDQAPEDQEKKVTLLLYFAQYMDEHLIHGGDVLLNQGQRPAVQLTSLFMKKWFRTNKAIVMFLNNGTLQVNFFEDHTKVILSPDGQDYLVTSINSKRQAVTFRLLQFRHFGCQPDVEERLRYARRMLESIINIDGEAV